MKIEVNLLKPAYGRQLLPLVPQCPRCLRILDGDIEANTRCIAGECEAE